MADGFEGIRMLVDAIESDEIESVIADSDETVAFEDPSDARGVIEKEDTVCISYVYESIRKKRMRPVATVTSTAAFRRRSGFRVVDGRVVASRAARAGDLVGPMTGHVMPRTPLYVSKDRPFAFSLDDAQPIVVVDADGMERTMAGEFDIDGGRPHGKRLDALFAEDPAMFVREGSPANSRFRHLPVTTWRGSSMVLPLLLLTHDVAAGAEVVVTYAPEAQPPPLPRSPAEKAERVPSVRPGRAEPDPGGVAEVQRAAQDAGRRARLP